MQNLTAARTLLGSLACPPLALPRYFFQQLWRTKVKLNILPQPREHEQCLQLQARLLQLTVEGVIDSDNPKRVRRVEVRVFQRADKETEPVLAGRRQVQLSEGDSYFKEQFLLTIKKVSAGSGAFSLPSSPAADRDHGPPLPGGRAERGSAPLAGRLQRPSDGQRAGGTRRLNTLGHLPDSDLTLLIWLFTDMVSSTKGPRNGSSGRIP